MIARLGITEAFGSMTGLACLVYTSLIGQRLAVSGIQFDYGLDKNNTLIVFKNAGQSWNCNIAVMQTNQI